MRNFSMAVAIDQHHGFKPFSRSQRCRLQSYTYIDCNILHACENGIARALKDALRPKSFQRSVSTPCLSFATDVDGDFENSNPIIEIVGGRRASRVRALVVEVAMALASGMEPVPVSSGLGSAYFLHGQSGDVIAVVKPIDEEPLAFNNPTGFGGLMLGQPRSVRVGETGIRELAAYLLDHGGFAGVPPTALVKTSHLPFYVNDSTAISNTPHKIASVQRFVPHDFDAGELGSSSFSVASVHRIGILDVRLLNLDRHAGNILVKKNENHSVQAADLVPIDHGLCLPEWLDDPYFEWLHWSQASIPFQETEVEYISRLDPFDDAKILRTEVPSLKESSIRVLILCTIFLKQAVAAGLCLANIGEMMTRGFYSGQENTSTLEILCMKAKATAVHISIDDHNDDNDKSKMDIEESDIFQLDVENESVTNKGADLPKLFETPPKMAKPPRCPGSSNVRCLPGLNDAISHRSYKGDTDHKNGSGRTKLSKDGDMDENNGSEDDGRVGGLMKSMSLSGENYSFESGGISFGDMSEAEWEVFLQNFEKLLPEVFEATKCVSPKQRLGTS